MKKNLSLKSKQRISKRKDKKEFKFKSKVIIWRSGNYEPGDEKGAWRFARVPENISAKIKEMQQGKLRRGWGAVYARARIGKSEWVTSVFPNRHSNTYILPLKKQIRYEENLYDGKEFRFAIEVWF